ncbi:hypothetical protein SK3146_00907 [Paenibacillus konkukensis]|uniref:HPP family protein n=1 Tax=Paenibacillus konkukensis TaxID=2020716 RepID=A0ABY4RH32_9BACL|nr:hypothetical protein [Paenibacillus konkukensis]UQZ81751.1 hypothetical protein SK3146_00907 [Paenibacillus konkukensis]
MNITKKAVVGSYFAAFAFILSMVGGSVLWGSKECILPEMAAMAVAMWAYRDPNWLRDPLNICLAPSLTSVIGFSVNQLHLAYLAKVGLTFILIMLILRLIRSNFAPSLATGLLPLITDAHDWTLVLLIFSFTFVFMLAVIWFRWHRPLQPIVHSPSKNTWMFLLLLFLWLGVCGLTGFERLAVIPPVIVVIYESIQKPDYTGKTAFKQGIALTVSATVGTLLFYAIDAWLLVTLLDIVLMLLLQLLMKVRMPAIYAFPLLPFLFPDDIVPQLPLGTLCACLFLFALAAVYKKYDASAAAKSTGVSV